MEDPFTQPQPQSPLPWSVTMRRNPHRRARPTPSKTISNFPIDDILSMDIHQPNPNFSPKPPIIPSNSLSQSQSESNSLNVFLRIRPLPIAQKSSKIKQPKAKNLIKKSILTVNDLHSVTISPPCENNNRSKSEIYNGFARVFDSDASQGELYENMMSSIVEDFLKGKSGLLAALGPSGSGKTHTVFGSAKDPGLVPRVLRRIFESELGNGSKLSRSFYLSVFEIYSEKGKGEKLCDLSPDGGDIYMQQSVVKGLKEVMVTDLAHAESVVAQATSKRATAMTNSNGQSSRSQCIINIRCAVDEMNEENEYPLNGAILTFVDLAGAEREKKTGNQGGRLRESNFINNTSMVFGLCLRSLLEHQKNPKKPLQKHFQSSLLTRYLRDYLEGRKRMALILTVRSGEEDYFDASYLLRQASPFMEIKFHNVEETVNIPGNKRRYQAICAQQQKRVKLSAATTYKDVVGKTAEDSKNFRKETELIEDLVGCQQDEAPGVKSNTTSADNCDHAKIERDYLVMRGVAKAMWNVLKQYKERVKIMQNEIDVLTEHLQIGRDGYLLMEKELYHLKTRCSCQTKIVPKEYKFTELECGEKGILGQAKAQCESDPQFEEVGQTAPDEEYMCSTSDCKESKASAEKHVDDQSDDDLIETSTSEVRCQSDEFEKSLLCNPDLRKEEGCISSSSIPTGSEEPQIPVSKDVSKVSQRTFPSSTKILESLDVNRESDRTPAFLRKPSQDATLSSLDCETSPPKSYQVQHFPTESELSHDHVSRNGGSKKRPTRNDDDKESKVSSDDAACLPQPHVMDLMVQSEKSDCNTHEKEDKENVATGPVSNFSSELGSKQTSQCRPLNAKRPKRRLMPASSLLLRDVSGLDVADESENLRRGKSGQRLVEGERSRGNASLFRLLKNHLPR